MSDYSLGDRVKFSHVLVRDGRWDEQERVEVRRWDPVNISGEGMIVGQRTLSNGHIDKDTEYDEWTGGTYTQKTWVGRHFFQAYMVVEGLRTRHVFVLPEHLEAP